MKSARLFIYTSFALLPCLSHADITTDGSVGAAQSLTGPDFAIGADLGQQRGGNLFHSYSQFNIATGESATTSGPQSITNIVQRVTGGEISTIDGLLRSTIDGANMVLMNSAGVLFGANASIDISGSLHITSADYVTLDDLTQFLATPLEGEILSTAAPAAFGFLGSSAGSIELQGTDLTLASDRTLTLSGNGIEVVNANVQIDGGNAFLASIGGAGEFNVDGGSVTPATLADINITGSQINVDGEGAGAIKIAGGDITFDGSSLSAIADGALAGGDISISASTLEFANGSSIIAGTAIGSTGDSGNIILSASNGIDLSTTTIALASLGSGQAGALFLDAPVITGSLSSSYEIIFGTTSDIVAAIDISGARSIEKTGSNVLTLSGTNTYTGTTTINGGTLQIGNGAASGSVAGDITNNGTLVFNRSDDYTYGGIIDGTGDLIHDGSILRLASAQTYTGATSVKAGGILVLATSADQGLSSATTVDLESGASIDLSNRAQTFSALTGAGSVYSAGGSAGHLTLDIGNGQTSTFSGSLGGAHADFALTKSGAGTQVLSGANTYTGATNLDVGSLYVEGSLGNTAVTVANATTLGGSGSIAGNVTVQNGGTLAPGSSPGILTVGSLDLESGSKTAMEINGLTPGTDHDQIVVNGTANLSGDLDLAFAGSEPVNGQSYTLIDAAAISGDFEAINYLFDKEIVYDTTITDDYIFNIIAIATDFASLAGLDPELLQIATLLDDNFSDSGLIPIINALNLLPEAEQASAFQQMSAPELTVLENFTFANARLVSTRLRNRQRDVRQGMTGFSTAGFHLYDETGLQIRNSLLADNSQSLPAGTQTQPLNFDSGLSTYISGGGTKRDLDGDSHGAGYEDDSFALILGTDYRLIDNLAVGAYIGYNHTNADLDLSGSDAELDSYRVGFTSTYWDSLSDASADIQRSYYATAHMGFAHHEYETNRSAFGGVASGDTNAFEFDLGTAIGYEVDLDGLVLTTELSLDYINLDMDGYAESGSHAPLAISDDRSESLYSTLSLRVDYRTAYRGVALLPYAHAGWRHEYLDDSNSLTARFASSPVGAFTSEGASVDRDSLISGFGLGAEIREDLVVQLGYYGELSSDYESHSLLGSLNLKF